MQILKQQTLPFIEEQSMFLRGGDPCQPSSVAGKRKGKEDYRYLWPEYRRCYNECLPRWIVNENVEGTISNGILDQKISDLGADGYTCWPPIVIPAGALGALHRRNRVWLVAYTDIQGFEADTRRTLAQKGKARKAIISDTCLLASEWSDQWSSKERLLQAAHGIPGEVARTSKIEGYGNAIAPQVAYQLFKAIELYKNLNNE